MRVLLTLLMLMLAGCADAGTGDAGHADFHMHGSYTTMGGAILSR